ncbi:DUF2690 domain-containing protein [Streptacidiphilus sp. 4-A2]|nr:DUF2690 domain-containing protein [Streptacidiphilus sp. 4-A2]
MERYLNGKALPPWPAVQELCALADEPQAQLRALWELADATWSGAGQSPRRTGRSPPRGRSGLGRRPHPRSPKHALSRHSRRNHRPHGRRYWRAGRSRRPRCPCWADCGPGAGSTAARPCWPGWPWPARHSPRAPPMPGTAPRPGGANSSASVSAAPGVVRILCHGASCDGRDPQQMNCGVTPQTLGDYPTSTGAELEIRYNAQCQAAWTRAWTTQVGDRISISTPGEPTRTTAITNTYTATGYAYTLMTAVGQGACCAPV